MILRLRRAHRRATLAATLLAGAGLAAAVAAHVPSAQPVPTPAALGALELPALPVGARLLGAARLADATARLYAVPSGPALLELQTAESDGAVRGMPAQPDVLLYWAPGATTDASEPLAGAYLLGAAPTNGAPRRYPLPGHALEGSGRLLLWSLGHHELVAVGPSPEPGAPASAPAPAGEVKR